MGLSMTEILVILLVVLLLFGAKRIPDLARALGRASYEFKKAKDNISRETDSLMEESEKNAAAKDAAEKNASSKPSAPAPRDDSADSGKK